MKFRNRALGLLLFGLAGALAPTGFARSRKPAPKPIQTEMEFLSCHDGDTCTARSREGFTMTLRLLGVDAPEVASGRGKRARPGQAYGREAAEYLNQQVKGRTLPVEIRGGDVFHRYLAIIFADPMRKTRVNEEIVRRGFAFAYHGTAPVDADIRAWSEAAEGAARRAKAGFWARPESERPQDPSQFRKKNK